MLPGKVLRLCRRIWQKGVCVCSGIDFASRSVRSKSFMNHSINIAIDGPAAGGKTTVARILAKRLGLLYLDTGVMYRAAAWQALQLGIAPDDAEAVGSMAEKMDLVLEPDPESSAGCRVLVGGKDITDILHAPEVNAAVSKTAAVSRVRTDMVRRQREMASKGGIVMAGRDICTVVMPDAEFKYFLDASLEERARRRFEDMKSRPGNTLTLEDIREQLAKRDYDDSHRADSPLVQAEGAVYIDCSTISAEEVAERICRDCREASETK